MHNLPNQQYPATGHNTVPIHQNAGFENGVNPTAGHTNAAVDPNVGYGNTVNTGNVSAAGQPTGAYTTTDTAPHGTVGNSVGARAGASTGSKIKGVAQQAHGLGEALRGNLNAAVDAASGDTAGQAKNERVIHKGADEVNRGHYNRGGV